MFLSHIDISLSLPSSLSKSNGNLCSGEDLKKKLIPFSELQVLQSESVRLLLLLTLFLTLQTFLWGYSVGSIKGTVPAIRTSPALILGVEEITEHRQGPQWGTALLTSTHTQVHQATSSKSLVGTSPLSS